MNAKVLAEEEAELTKRLEQLRQIKERLKKAVNLREFADLLEHSRSIAFGQYRNEGFRYIGIVPKHKQDDAVGACSPICYADNDTPDILPVILEAACHYIRQQADKIQKEAEAQGWK